MNKLYQDRNWLYRKYSIEKMLPIKIGKLCGVCNTTIFNWLEKLHIEKYPMKDRIFSKEHCKNISKSRIGKFKGINNTFYGKHHTEKTKEIIRIKNKGNIPPNKGICPKKILIKCANPACGKMFLGYEGRMYCSKPCYFVIPKSEETKKKNARHGKDNNFFGVHRLGKDSPNWGKKRTDETKKKISIHHLGKDISLEAEEIIRMYRGGLRVQRIVKKFGVSVDTIQERILDINKVPRFRRVMFSESDYNMLFEMFVIEEKNISELAIELGCSKKGIRNGLIRCNIPLRSQSESQTGMITSKETKRKISEANKGKHLTEETKRKISEAHIKEKKIGICLFCGKKIEYVPSKNMKYCDRDCSVKYKMGENNPHWKGGMIKKKCIICGRIYETYPCKINQKCCSMDCARQKAMMTMNIKPSNPEKVFDKITPNNIRYTGNGTWCRRTKIKYRNPDFKITGQNKVIEIYGDYWHRNDDPKDIIQEYKEIGIECIVLWEHEVYEEPERVLNETLEFIGDHSDERCL